MAKPPERSPRDSSFLARYLTPPENAYRKGDEVEPEPQERLQADVYQELRRRAAILMRGQPRNHTLQATALVHEVFLKLGGEQPPGEEERGRFLALASRAMRHVLVDHARTRNRKKRTPDGERVLLDEVVLSYADRAFDLLALDEALERLAGFDEEMARAVELRFFGGLSVDETARIIGMPKRTLERRWQAVRAWLYGEVT